MGRLTQADPLLRRGKLERPTLGDAHLQRPALCRHLDAIQQCPVALVCAPAGSGKTTLVGEWASTSALPVAWLSLDAGDVDLTRLLRHLVAAIRGVAPDGGGRTEGLLDAGERGTPAQWAESLSRDLDDVQPAFTLVLDAYDQVPGREVHDVLAGLLEYPPRSLHLVIVTRIEPPLPLAALRGQGRLVEIRQRELAFTPEETVAFFEHTSGRTLTPDSVARIQDRLGGWAAGLSLLAQSFRDGSEPSEMLERLPEGVPLVESYFRTEFFDRQPVEMQDQLLFCSVLDRFTAPLCEAVCPAKGDGPTGAEFVERAERELGLLERVDAEGPWLRFHPVFREFLLAHLEQRLSRPEIQNLHDRASAWFHEHGHVKEAVEHALLGRDPRSAARTLFSRRVELLNEGRIGDLVHLAGLLPELETGDLDVLLLRAYAVPTALVPEAVARIEAALAAEAETSESADAVRGELRFLQMVALFTKSLDDPLALPSIVEQGEEALTLLPRTFRETRAAAAHLLAQALQMTGDTAGARAALDAGEEEHILAAGEPLLTIRFAKAVFQYAEADLEAARNEALACIAMPLESAGRTPFFEQARVMLALIHYGWNELEQAEQILLDPATVPNTNVLRGLALVRQAAGRPGEADAAVAELVAMAAKMGDPVERVLARATEAEIAHHQGRVEVALDWARGAATERIRPLSAALSAMLVKARILVTCGAPGLREDAEDAVQTARRFAETTHNRRAMISVHALQALLCAASSDDAAAQNALCRSLELAAPGHFVRPYLDCGPGMRELLVRLDAPAGLEDYVRRLLKAFAAEGAELARPARQPILDPLTDRELEILALLAERLANKEIAARLYVSVETVKKHATTIYQKLHVHGRRAAVAKAASLGLLPDA